MGRIFAGLIGLLVIIGLIFSGWYYRPWSPYSPARITALDQPELFPVLFQQMDDILPSSVIKASNPTALPKALSDLPQTYRFDGEDRSLEAYIDRAEITGLTVMHNGTIVHESSYHGATTQTRHTSYSVAKTIVATLIAKAMHDGLIDSMDDTAEQYAPQFAGTDYGQTSLRDLLMMSAGMDFNEHYGDEGGSDIRPLFFNAFIMRKNVDTMVAKFKRNRPAGEDFHYTSPNTHVLAAVARGVYGGRLVDIISEQFWGPLGMHDDASWLQNIPGEDGIAIGYCCLQATSADYARFGEFYRLNGVWEGKRLLPETWVATATVPNAPFQEPGRATNGPRGYGLHIWIPHDYDREYVATGVFGQYIWIDERRGIVIAQNAGDPLWNDRFLEAYTVFRTIAEHISPLETLEDNDADHQNGSVDTDE